MGTNTRYMVDERVGCVAVLDMDAYVGPCLASDQDGVVAYWQGQMGVNGWEVPSVSIDKAHELCKTLNANKPNRAIVEESTRSKVFEWVANELDEWNLTWEGLDDEEDEREIEDGLGLEDILTAIRDGKTNFTTEAYFEILFHLWQIHFGKMQDDEESDLPVVHVWYAFRLLKGDLQCPRCLDWDGRLFFISSHLNDEVMAVYEDGYSALCSSCSGWEERNLASASLITLKEDSLNTMLHKGYEIEWNSGKLVFEVKNKLGNVKFSSSIGKECWDWVNEQDEKKGEVEDDNS